MTESAHQTRVNQTHASGSGSADTVLRVRDLHTFIRLRQAEVRAVDGVSFDVKRGETLGLVGESGCGKTMTGMSVMRLLPTNAYIAAGSIQIGDVDLVSAPMDVVRRTRANHIGMIFQDPMTSLDPTMTIGRQIAEPVHLHKQVSRRAAKERAVEVLGLVGVPRPRERMDYYPHQLSGGLRQRVMIAMAVACEPELIIADEPTTALDVSIQAQILTLLDRLRAQLGMALILITHDMGLVAERSDRVMVMYAGKMVETADTAKLFKSTRHPYTEALLASIPHLDQDSSQRLSTIPGLPPDLTRLQTGCRFAPRCTYADESCLTQEPPIQGLDSDHAFACFHPRGSANPIQAPGPAGATGSSEPTSTSGLRLGRAAEAVLSPNPRGGDGPDTILELRSICKEFAVTAGSLRQRRVGLVRAVSDVTLAVRRGETFGLVGESGCGKTTLGRLIVALEAPSRGQLCFEGTDLGSLSPRQLKRFRRSLQMVFQDPYASLDPRMRIGATVREPLAIQGLGDRNSQNRRVTELLHEVGLPSKAAAMYPHEFSGGQRQRVGLARALALSPKLIVADEPVSALDVSIRSQILNLMKSLQAAHGLTYVFVSHDLSVVRYLADRIGVMYAGSLVEIGTSDDIYAHAAHPYTQGLLDSIPNPKRAGEDTARAQAGIPGELPSALEPPTGCRFRTRCPRAQARCETEAPSLTKLSPNHQVACHFPLQPSL